MTNINDRLRETAEKGDAEAIKNILFDHCNRESVNSRSRGRTALMSAAEHGHALCVQLLLPLSDALTKGKHGWTALMYAASRGHTSCVQILLPVSDVLAKDNTGNTALMCAVRSGNVACLKCLLPVSDALARNMQNINASELATFHRYNELSRLIDAYALSVTERALLNSSASSALPSKSRSLRV